MSVRASWHRFHRLQQLGRICGHSVGEAGATFRVVPESLLVPLPVDWVGVLIGGG
jgi:hypothetical protein